MAAEYGININVRTKDEKLKVLQKNLTAADRAVASLQKKLEKLEKTGKKGSGTSGGPFSAEAIKARKEVTKKTKEAQIDFERYTK